MRRAWRLAVLVLVVILVAPAALSAAPGVAPLRGDALAAERELAGRLVALAQLHQGEPGVLAFQAAFTALEARLPESAPAAAVAARLAVAQAVMQFGEHGAPDALAAFDLAEVVHPTMGDVLALPGSRHDLPSRSVAALLELYDLSAPPDQQDAIARLDALPEPARDALTDVVDRFLDLDAAVRQARATPDPERLVGAQRALLASALRLQAAIPAPLAHGQVAPLVLTPALALDLGGTATRYDLDVALSIDLGGDDTYLNNAGGSGLRLPDPLGLGLFQDPCQPAPQGFQAAAALLDLSGHDAYVGDRDCGANGGGWVGAGLLFDSAGDDVYLAGDHGTNGGADGDRAAAGLLVDLAGADAYRAGWYGVNGGGAGQAAGGAGPRGMLLDLGGSDRFAADYEAVNGGGSGDGTGFLLDARGDDVYNAGGYGANGGGNNGGLGALVDLSGADLYVGWYGGTNGGATASGQGFLLDTAGNDRYVGSSGGIHGGTAGFYIETYPTLGLLADLQGSDLYEAYASRGANGGSAGGVGLLLDATGNDVYLAREGPSCSPYTAWGACGANGGGVYGGFGFLVDASGHDTYLGLDPWGAPSGGGVNGGGRDNGHGLLFDAVGDDRYAAGGQGANGGGSDGGRGLLVDSGGADRYEGTTTGVNGGGAGGAGFLLDAGGDDSYTARTEAANGGAAAGCLARVPTVPNEPSCVDEGLGVGVLLDLGGADVYDDLDGGEGPDRTVVPKGVLGAQVDAEA